MKSKLTWLAGLCFAFGAVSLAVHAAIAPVPLPPAYAHPHGVIPVLHAEHAAIHSLVQDSQATHRAVKSGNWNDAATWGGVVPGDGARVIVPAGLLVDYAIESNADIATIRLDGALRFSRTANTKLRVDTLVVTADGMLDLGRQADPITAKCEIVISGTNEIDPAVDPREIGKGIISQGYFYACGKTKLAWSDLTAAPKIGDTVLKLESPPAGWEAGDELVLAGTKSRFEHQHELLKVVAVNGNEVTFEPPLKFNHALTNGTPYAPTDKFAFVQNLTRNVVVRSEVESYGVINPVKPWGMAPENKRRGHVMIHTSGVSKSILLNTRFHSLGRTDKRLLTSTPIVADDGTRTNKFGYEYWNPLGRYSVHWHRPGPTTAPGVCKGCVCDNSPGWGFAVHGANVELDDGVAFDCCGAGFATEDGSERGWFRNCAAIFCRGKEIIGQDIVYKSEIGQSTGDGGIGFWSNSARQKKQRLRASDCALSGMFFWMNNINQDEGSGGRSSFIHEVDVGPDDYLKPYFVDGKLGIDRPAFEIEDWRALSSDGIHIEAANSVVKKSVARKLETIGGALSVAYTTATDIYDSQFIGTNAAGTMAMPGTAFVGGMRYFNCTIKGFPIGQILPRNGSMNEFKDCTFVAPSGIQSYLAYSVAPQFGVTAEQILPQYSFSGLALTPATPTGLKPKPFLWRPILSATNRQYSDKYFLLNRVLWEGKQAYFPEQASDFVPFPTAALSAVGAGTGRSSVPPQYRDKTNQQLFDEFGTCMYGVPMPTDAAVDPVFGYPTGTPTPRLGIRLHSPSFVKPTSAYTLQVKAFKPGDVAPGALGYTVETIGTLEIKSGWNVLTFELPAGERHAVEVYGEATAPPPPPPPATVASVIVAPASATVEVGKSVQLTATAKDAAGVVIAGKTFVWTSSQPGVATVSSSGQTIGVMAGQTTITAAVDGKSGTATVTVIKPTPVPVVLVTINPAQASIAVGSTIQFTAVAKDANGTVLSRPFIWSSSNPQAASVNSTGFAQGLVAGQAKVTATCEGVAGQAALTVTTVPTPAKAIKSLRIDYTDGTSEVRP